MGKEQCELASSRALPPGRAAPKSGEYTPGSALIIRATVVDSAQNSARGTLLWTPATVARREGKMSGETATLAEFKRATQEASGRNLKCSGKTLYGRHIQRSCNMGTASNRAALSPFIKGVSLATEKLVVATTLSSFVTRAQLHRLRKNTSATTFSSFVTRARLQPGRKRLKRRVGASQAAEKLFLYRKAKNRSRQEALGAIRKGRLMV